MIDIERVDHIGIRVTDVERALAFYQVLGFEVFLRVFVRDPDLNVIELRGKEQDLSDVEGVTFYQP